MKQVYDFNPSAGTWLHIDLNSCFASIEQQANSHLRGKPIAVAAYATDYGCILAPSIEAKTYGIKTGMRVKEAKQLCPKLIVRTPDPPKYRFVNKAFFKLFSEYSPHVSIRSIDEMLLNFFGLPVIANKSLVDIGSEIKIRIKKEIGNWLRVSIGISTNPYLAKLAATLFKPDGLYEISYRNILKTLSTINLVDLPYIKERNQVRLNRKGIYTPLEFYFAPATKLKSAFESVVGDYWYLRLHGYSVDEVEWQQKTIGHSYHLPKFTADKTVLKKLLCKLVEKMGRRIRTHNYTAAGIHIACLFADGSHWHKNHTFTHPMYATRDLFHAACYVLDQATPLKAVRILAVSAFNLKKNLYAQLTLFEQEEEKRALVTALDKINNRWGEFTIVPGMMLNMQNAILDRIAFGGGPELRIAADKF